MGSCACSIKVTSLSKAKLKRMLIDAIERNQPAKIRAVAAYKIFQIDEPLLMIQGVSFSKG